MDVTAGIDLALTLVEDDHGPSLARDVARSLVVFLQRPGGQSQFSVPSRTPIPRNKPLRDLLDAVTTDPAGSYSVPELAAATRTRTRHLTRLFRQNSARRQPTTSSLSDSKLCKHSSWPVIPSAPPQQEATFAAKKSYAEHSCTT
jgi:transcriptional regulator GlxA family with amidase domain